MIPHEAAPATRQRMPFEKRMSVFDIAMDEYRTDAVLAIIEAFGRDAAAELINEVLNGDLSPVELRQATVETLVKQRTRTRGKA